jgi:protease I
MSKKVVLVIASNGYQPIEYLQPKNQLEAAGFTVITASDKPGGAITADGSTSATVDITVDKLDMSHYDALFFIGGSGALDCLDNSDSYKIITQAKKLGKWYGAICISTRILAKAHALEGVQATGWDNDNALETLLKGHKAIYVKEPVVVDQKVITAVGPHAAKDWGREIVNQLQ